MARSRNRFGTRLRRARLAGGLSQEKLAELAGVSRDAVVRLEAGERGPRFATAVALAEALGIPPANLAGDTPAEDERLAPLAALLRGADDEVVAAVLAIARQVVRLRSGH